MIRLFLAATILFQSIFSFAGPTEDLVTAINNTDLAGAKAAIAAGADVNALDSRGFPAIMLAIWQPEIVKEIIAAKADLNKSNSTGAFTPLTFALYLSVAESAQLIAEAGADINLKTGTGTSPLHAAIMSSRLDLVKYIIAKGGDPKATFGFNQNLIMLFAAFGKSPYEKVDFFISMEEATIKAGNKVPAKIKENQNPALFTPTLEMLDYLLSLGFDINEERDVLMPANMPNAESFNKTSLKGKVKQSAVSVAFNLGSANADVLAALLSKGAKLDKKEFTVYFKTKRFPTVRIPAGDLVLVAVKSGNVELVKTIVGNTKVNINKGYNGVFVQELDVKLENLTPLMIAAANDDRAMCEYLVSIGARGMPMAKINLPPGSKLSATYVFKAASYAEDFTTDEELKKYLKSLTK